jgi:hypothetical protein
MPDKYEFTGETLQLVEGNLLHRIWALIDIPRHGVKVGDVGGWVESTLNLAHEDEAWVGGDARVFGCALIAENALVTGSARVSGRAIVFGNARISGAARLSGFAVVSS